MMPTSIQNLASSITARAARAAPLAGAATLAALVALATGARAQTAPGDGTTLLEADDHLERRCEPGPKQEHCYWTKVKDSAAAQR